MIVALTWDGCQQSLGCIFLSPELERCEEGVYRFRSMVGLMILDRPSQSAG